MTNSTQEIARQLTQAPVEELKAALYAEYTNQIAELQKRLAKLEADRATFAPADTKPEPPKLVKPPKNTTLPLPVQRTRALDVVALADQSLSSAEIAHKIGLERLDKSVLPGLVSMGLVVKIGRKRGSRYKAAA